MARAILKTILIGITHSGLYSIVKKGTEILVDDGYFSFEVHSIEAKKIICKSQKWWFIKT